MNDQPAIRVVDVVKRFRLPQDRSSTLKYRMVHPLSTRRYRDFTALDDITFDVAPGEFLGIIGHNGCGKSTLLKLLANIYRPTEGRIEVLGKVSPFLELGVGFNPELTARENIFLSGAVLGITRRELATRVDSILHFAELEHAAEQKVKTFSSGMEVRLAFSVAIQAHADILLMDEVLAVGDARFQAKCFDVFARYKRDGRTVILVTHDLSAVELYCDRALLLDHGVIAADGPAAEVTAQYRRRVGAQEDADAASEHAGTNEALAAGAGSNRHWGTGEVRFTDVGILAADGEPHHTLVSGEAAAIRLRLRVHEPVDEVICGISLHRPDGYTLAGTNTWEARFPVPALPAGSDMELRYDVPQLPLLGGRYLLTCAVHSRHGARVYDQLDQMFEFDVVDESGRIGHFDLSGRWSLSTALSDAPTPRLAG